MHLVPDIDTGVECLTWQKKCRTLTVVQVTLLKTNFMVSSQASLASTVHTGVTTVVFRELFVLYIIFSVSMYYAMLVLVEHFPLLCTAFLLQISCDQQCSMGI